MNEEPTISKPQIRRPKAPGFLLVLLLSIAASLGQPKSGLRLPEPVNPVEAAEKGRALVAGLLAQTPQQGSTNTGVLKIREGDGPQREVPVRFDIVPTATNWLNVYEAAGTAQVPGQKLTIFHSDAQPSQYLLSHGATAGGTNATVARLTGNQIMVPFAGSDFWVADLGLEFLHWPKQLVLKHELRRSQSCDVLESTNPNPAPGAYSRVVSWIGIETGAIIFAEGYDFRGNLLKEFAPKGVKKVDGQWQLEEMEIRNRQTGSRTRIEFNLRGEGSGG